MLEIVACYYSFSDCQILVGKVDEEGNLIISQGMIHRKIAIAECAKEVINISDYIRRIWTNKHEPLKKALSARGVSGEVDFSQEDTELKDLFLSLKHTQKIKMSTNLEAIANQFPLALQILIKALINPLTGGLRGSALQYGSPIYSLEDGEVDPISELKEALKMFDTF